MQAITPYQTQQQPPRAAERVARAWGLALAGTSYVSMTGREIQDFLTGLANRLIRALTAETFDDAVVREVGATLVAAHFTQPRSLDNTIQVLAEQFTGAPAGRVAQIQGALASGYSEALRDRVLGEQEEIRTAALWARARAEEARWASEARFRAVFTEAAIGMGIATTDGRITEVNQTLCDMLGYSAEEFRTRTVDEFFNSEDAPALREAYDELSAGGRDHLRFEKPFFHKEGRLVWTDLVVSLVRDQRGRPRFMVAMIEDITDRYMLQVRLRHQALHDPLTELPNRTLFFDRLAEILEDDDEEARVGICYLDFDGFKVINDTLGHDVGDKLLMAVARRLDAAVSAPGQVVARMGGDEFVVLVERSSGIDDLAGIGAEALAAVRTPVRLEGHEISVSASVGVVERPVRGTSAAELMKAADTTLYWAKGDGRNRVALFDLDRHDREVARYELAASMPAALERGEFFLDYQPLVRLDDGAVTGVEALVRWRHPRLGVLGPDQFISLAEESGLIVPLGRWVLREACRQAATWQQERGEPTVMSVNVAVRQIHDRAIVDDVSAILVESGLDPATVQLELTESAVMATDGPRDALRGLADLGVRIAVDDFGTGYSNFAYLRNLPLGALKLAGSFVAGLRPPERPDPVDEQIVAAVINLAHALGLTVTAEGVETPEQVDRLRALGCDTGQGWYYAEAGPPEKVFRPAVP